MTVTAASFRQVFPAFADTGKYSDPMVNFWITTASGLLDPGRWGTLLDYGTQLLVAHNLVLQGADLNTAAFGGNPGVASGPVSSKGVDKVNISFDTVSAAEDGAGAYNLTVYGQQFIRQARIIGMGPVQIDAQTNQAGDGGVSQYAGGWAGPFSW